jgi:hypothetical protein
VGCHQDIVISQGHAQVGVAVGKKAEALFCAMQAGDLVMAQVKSIAGSCIVCHLADGSRATAALTSLHDMFVPNALQGIRVGAVVRAKVASSALDDKQRVPLTLQQRHGASHSGTLSSSQHNCKSCHRHHGHVRMLMMHLKM